MRVAVVSPYGLGRYGGVQDQALRLVEWLGDAGHDAWLVAPDADGRGVSIGNSVLVRANRSVAPVTLDPRSVGRARAAVAAADVVHLHEPFVPLAGLGVLFATTPPKVGTFHADPSRLVRRLYRLGRPVLARAASRLAVATAPSAAARAPLDGIVDARIVPNGVDVAAYRPDVPRDPRRVAFLGRADARKGLDVLLEAWPAVGAEIAGAELVVIGAEGAPVPGVRFMGRVAEDAKRQELAGAAVYCAPNLGGESFGLVLAEAMAAGCAVVASALPAFEDVLAGSGVLVPVGDAPALARALVAVLGSEAHRAELAAAAAARVRAFDRSTVLAGYLDAYEDAVRVGRKPAE